MTTQTKYSVASATHVNRSSTLSAFSRTEAVGGSPSGAAWVRDIDVKGKVVGIEVEADERTDVFVGVDNEHVEAVLALVQRVKSGPTKTASKQVSVIEYTAAEGKQATDKKKVTVTAYMITATGEKVGPWAVSPIVKGSW
jgi:hypothetical protein